MISDIINCLLNRGKSTSVATFYWLVEAYRRRDGYQHIPEQSMKSLDTLSAGYSLLWESHDIQQVLCSLDIFSDSPFYEKYHKIFTLIRNRYHHVLKQFGIGVDEIQAIYEDFHARNVVTFFSEKLKT